MAGTGSRTCGFVCSWACGPVNATAGGPLHSGKPLGRRWRAAGAPGDQEVHMAPVGLTIPVLPWGPGGRVRVATSGHV